MVNASWRTSTAVWLFSAALLPLNYATPANAEPAKVAAPTDVPAWPKQTKPATLAPSILLVMTDDVGFGAASGFGGPIATPTFDGLVRTGAAYNQITTTGICSPTRAALLTGRNHNAVNVGNVVDAATGYDGFTSDIPKSAATSARLLADAGYGTAMFGKGHITPLWETGPSGPFDHWPTGLGFHYFYGFLSGDTNQWAPALYENVSPVEAPSNDPNYILDRDLAYKAITWIRRQRASAPAKPLFIYFAPGTAHAPHHAPREWIDRYKVRFDQGWDAVREETLRRQIASGIAPAGTRLAGRPAQIPEWSTLTVQQKRVYAKEMEVYAGALSFADHEIGRVVDEMHRQVGDNLLVVYLQGDNGASAEAGLNGTLNEHSLFQSNNPMLDQIDEGLDKMGGPMAANSYSSGWAFAMNAPFPWVKQVASHFGATRNGMVVDWRGHIAAPGTLRRQFAHVTDIMPTILDAAGVTPPNRVDGVVQQPLDGISLTYTFTQPKAPSQRRTQYYEIWDNMAIYHDGWVAASVPTNLPWVFDPHQMVPTQVEGRKWQLFDITHDFSESRDLAEQQPKRLEELKTLFFAEAARNKALPVHRYEGAAGRPSSISGITEFKYFGPVNRIPEDVAPRLTGQSFSITAEITVGKDPKGTLLALGGRFGGVSLGLEAARPTFNYNFANLDRVKISAPQVLSPGAHKIGLVFDRAPGERAPARVTLSVDGSAVATGDVARTVSGRFSLDESFDIGSDTGTPVTEAHASPDIFTGTISVLTLQLGKPSMAQR